MLRSGTRGRRFWLAVAAAAIAAMLGTGIALAASDTIVAAGESFDRQGPTGDTPYNTDPGVVVQFQDAGGIHNVTARTTGPDGQALFRSPTINGAGSAGVDGTQYLAPGDYQFFCTVHPTTMHGTLHVTGNGTPQARPSVTLKGRKTSVAKAIKKGVLVNINASTKIDGAALSLKLGKATIGKATLSLAAGPQTDRIKLNKAGKSKLRHKSKAKLSVIGNIPFGFPASGKVKLG
jgi:plastocyanin